MPVEICDSATVTPVPATSAVKLPVTPALQALSAGHVADDENAVLVAWSSALDATGVV